MKKLYKCDPPKNTECKKNFCFLRGGGCSNTTNPEVAKLNKHGKPIEIPVYDEYEVFEVNDEIEQAFREGYNQGWEECKKDYYGNETVDISGEIQVIKIQGKLPSLNEYIEACRTNYGKGSRIKKEIESPIILQLARMKPITSPVIIHFLWHERTRRRDKDNVAAGKKFILDAMQKSGKLINDNNNYIKGFTDRYEYGGEYGCTITIEVVAE